MRWKPIIIMLPVDKRKITCTVLPLALLWVLMSTFGAGYLSQLEAEDLFIFSWDFFTQNLLAPGGLLSWAASFLTQFFYLPWLGALIWVLLCAWSVHVAGKLTGHDAVLSLFPAACSTAAAMGLGYLIFKMKLPAHAFTTLLGAIVSMAMACWYSRTRYKIACLAVIALSFHFIGFYALVAAMASAVWESRQKKPNWIYAGLMVVAALAVPAILGQFYLTARPDRVFLSLVPVLPKSCGFVCYIPYLLLFAYIIFGQLLHVPVRFRHGRVAEMASVALVVLVFWVKDPNFNAQMRMTTATDRMKWEKSLRAYRFAQMLAEPTSIMGLYRNLALVRLNIEGDECFSYRDGSKDQKMAVMISDSQQAGRQLFFHFGIPNNSYRWCFENQAETGWSVSDLRYMAMCCIVKGELETATKYLDILQKTLFYGRWANRQWKYLSQPELLKQSSEYGLVVSLLASDNELGNDASMLAVSLNTRFLTGLNNTPEQSRVALLWAALSQRNTYFWPLFNNYVDKNYVTSIPVQYQQAMLLMYYVSPDADINRIPFDPGVSREFNDFIGFFESHPISRENMQKAQRQYRRFRGTYYYYYLFRDAQSLVYYQNEERNTIYN